MDQLIANRKAALKEEFEDVLLDREIEIVDKMVMMLRSNKTNYENLYGLVSILSELRFLRDKLKSETLKAIEQVENQ